MPCVYAAPKYVSQVSRCASKWTTATGPCAADTARSMGSAMVWSPPSVSTNGARSSRARAPRSTAPIASSMLNGLTARSPASATCWRANTGTCSAGLYGRSSREDSLMWDGPNRAPGR